MSNYRYLHIAVEVAARELESKLLLALIANTRGFSVLVGEDNFFTRNMKKLPRGIFLDKSFTENHLRKNLAPAKRAGHIVAAIDEEGCETRNPLHMARFNRASLDLADLILAWGDDQAAQVAKRSPANGGKIVVSGSQRWDLLRSQGLQFYGRRVSALREIFGDFLLFNSNFTLASNVNTFDAVLKTMISNGTLNPDDADQLAWLERRRDYQAACMTALREGIRELAGVYPDRNILIRPHPAEESGPWHEAFEKLNNVHVVRLGSPEPWILASRLLIVSGCTTGMQAITMGQPVVTYCLDDDPEIRDNSLTNHICPRVSNPSAFLAMCDRLINDEKFRRAANERGLAELESHIAALDGPLAAERMVNAFCQLTDDRPAYQHRAPLDLARANFDLRNRRPNNPKFPDVAQDEIVARLDGLCTAFGIAASPRVTQVREKVFLLS